MAAKLDETAESICGPKWAIARDLSVYERNEDDATKTAAAKGGKVSADRGPPMVCAYIYLFRIAIYVFSLGMARSLRS